MNENFLNSNFNKEEFESEHYEQVDKMTEDKYKQLIESIDLTINMFNKLHGHYLSINKRFTDPSDFSKVTEFGINWGGLGTKTVNQTIEFINDLCHAIELVNELNKDLDTLNFNGIKYEY